MVVATASVILVVCGAVAAALIVTTGRPAPEIGPITVAGYRYDDLTPAQQDLWSSFRICEQINRDHPGGCLGTSGWNVRGANTGWVSLFLVQLSADQLPADFSGLWVDGYARKAEAEASAVEIQTRGSLRVIHASAPGGELYSWITGDGVITFVVGGSAPDTDDFVNAYLSSSEGT